MAVSALTSILMAVLAMVDLTGILMAIGCTDWYSNLMALMAVGCMAGILMAVVAIAAWLVFLWLLWQWLH